MHRVKMQLLTVLVTFSLVVPYISLLLEDGSIGGG